MKGKLIVVEGIDGCGKDTQIDMLVDSLNDNGYESVKRANVSTSPTGRVIREVLSKPELYVSNMQMATMFMTELYLVDKEIKELLNSGTNVIMSRWYYSTLAYAGKTLSDYLTIKELATFLTCVPDDLIYLDIPVSEAISRITKRDSETDKKLELYESENKLTAISKKYETVLQMITFDEYTKTNIHKINASNSINDIHDDIRKSLNV